MESEGAINSGQYAWDDEGRPPDDRNLVVRYAPRGVEQFTPEQVEAARRRADPPHAAATRTKCLQHWRASVAWCREHNCQAFPA